MNSVILFSFIIFDNNFDIIISYFIVFIYYHYKIRNTYIRRHFPSAVWLFRSIIHMDKTGKMLDSFFIYLALKTVNWFSFFSW